MLAPLPFDSCLITYEAVFVCKRQSVGQCDFFAVEHIVNNMVGGGCVLFFIGNFQKIRIDAFVIVV
jgi:hypothetical protein